MAMFNRRFQQLRNRILIHEQNIRLDEIERGIDELMDRFGIRLDSRTLARNFVNNHMNILNVAYNEIPIANRRPMPPPPPPQPPVPLPQDPNALGK